MAVFFLFSFFFFVAEVLFPLFWEIHRLLVPCVCRVPLSHLDYRFSKGHLHSKALFLEKEGVFLKMSLEDARMLSCPKKSPTSF